MSNMHVHMNMSNWLDSLMLAAIESGHSKNVEYIRLLFHNEDWEDIVRRYHARSEHEGWWSEGIAALIRAKQASSADTDAYAREYDHG
jgi:hypothetical protein